MHVQVRYQGLDNTQWMDDFITTRVSKLNRYLDQSSSIQVNLKYENKNKSYVTSLAIHHPYHDYAFTTQGLNLYESLADAVDKALRTLGEQKRKIKDKINKKYVSLKDIERVS